MDPNWKTNRPRNIVDDFSAAELLFDKHRTGPRIVFRETDTMFILTANLKVPKDTGYKRENIKVEIDKDGKRVAVIGEKLVQGTTVVGNKVYTKEMEMREFKRAFHFSDGVILDEIKARFDKKEFLLTISVPKLKKGFRGIRVEEVILEEIGETYESLPIDGNGVDERETMENDIHKEGEVKEEKASDKYVVKVNKEVLEKEDIVQVHDQTRINPHKMFKDQGFEGKQKSIDANEAQRVQEPDQTREFEENEKEKRIENEGVGAKRDECPKTKSNKCKLCNPVILGSTILLTISVLVMYLVRTQNSHRKKKN